MSCKITESEDFQRVKQVPKYINFENVFTHSSGDSRHFSVFIHEHVENAQFILVSNGRRQASDGIFNFSRFLQNKKSAELLNVIFETSSNKGSFR